MRIGAYQFAVTGDMAENCSVIRRGIRQAAQQHVRRLIFPECALTGYPPRDIPFAAAVDVDKLSSACARIQKMSDENNIHILVGSITGDNGICRNTALLFSPGMDQPKAYHKRALWGWDADNFIPGEEGGVFEIDGVKIGVRICFEVRFPEYFRELYRANTDVNVILFYDVMDSADLARYDLIKAHILTRAVENVCPVITVNSTKPYQTAPTLFVSRSGKVYRELPPGEEALLIAEWTPSVLDFGEWGRKAFADRLTEE